MRRLAGIAACLAALLGLAGCASMAGADRSYVNHKAMDLRVANDLGEPAPATGLRSLKKASGGEACSICAN